MTKKPVGHQGGHHDMPGAGAAKTAPGSTTTNPGAKRVPTVKGTPQNNKRHQHVRTARY